MFKFLSSVFGQNTGEDRKRESHNIVPELVMGDEGGEQLPHFGGCQLPAEEVTSHRKPDITIVEVDAPWAW